MSVTITRAAGVTVFTVTSEPDNVCPPLCQIFRGLCCSPVCCSVSQHLRTVQRTSQSVLGALHVMVGLLNIGLGGILCSGGSSWWRMGHTLFPFWFGGVFMFLGAVSILSEKCPSPCLVIVSVTLNLAGLLLAVAAIVLYSFSIMNIRLGWMCDDDYSSRYKTPSPYDNMMTEKCLEGEALVLMLMRSMSAVLIVLSVLELCVAVSSAVLGIKALRSNQSRENKSTDDPEEYKPLEEDTSNPTA